MKTIKRIEMANNNDIYNVETNQTLTIKQTDDNYYEIYADDELICDNERSLSSAQQFAEEYATDDGNLVIVGYGTHSGRKFWQLDDELQQKILKLAGF